MRLSTILNSLAARATAAVLAIIIASPVMAQTPPPPVVRPALDAIFEAFANRPIVALSDWHGLAQESDLYAAIVGDPRFAREVGNVVVEFGTASQQATVDRYVAGQDVPYVELRKVWSDVIGWTPFANSLGYAYFFAQVRAVNLALPPERRIRVWLGDPPVDWSKITGPAETYWVNRTRDSHAAGVIVDNILSRNRKALVIYGGFHLSAAQPTEFTRTSPRRGTEAALRRLLAELADGKPDYSRMIPEWREPMGQMQPFLKRELSGRGRVRSVVFLGGDRWGRDAFDVKFEHGETMRPTIRIDEDGRLREFDDRGFDLDKQVLRGLVEQRHPNSFFVVGPYIGLANRACSQRFEEALGKVAAPAMISGVDGSAVQDALRAPGCSARIEGTPSWGPWVPAAEQAATVEAMRAAARNAAPIDRLLYLGPAASLVGAPVNLDWYLDEAYRREIVRRNSLKSGEDYRRAVGAKELALTPRYFQPAPP